MSKETLVFVIGFFVLISPFLGIPRTYREWLLVILGGILMIVGYQLRRFAFLRSIEGVSGERRTNVFVEHKSLSENQNIERTPIETP